MSLDLNAQSEQILTGRGDPDLSGRPSRPARTRYQTGATINSRGGWVDCPRGVSKLSADDDATLLKSAHRLPSVRSMVSS